MKKFKRTLNAIIAMLLVVCIPMNLSAVFADGTTVYYSGDGTVENVILLLGDGMANNHAEYAQWFYNGAYVNDGNEDHKPLNMQQLPYLGITSTFSGSSSITDYAAAGTALATGVKTTNGKLSVASDGTELETVFDLAQDAGMATGVVTTGHIAKSTATAFMANAADAASTSAIVAQVLDSGVDLIYGGGASDIAADSATAKGYSVVNDKTEMASAEGKVMGLFADNVLTSSFNGSATEPSLAEMTDSAIDALSADEDGFFLVVESTKIAEYSALQSDTNVIQQVKLFDDAVKAAIDFADEEGNTLVIAAGSYETGGLTMPSSMSRTAGNTTDLLFTANGNTSVNVLVYAGGAGANEFTGVYDNTDIPKRIVNLLGLEGTFPTVTSSYGTVSEKFENIHKDNEVKNIIYFIGDGTGQNHIQYSQWYYQGAMNKFNVQKMPVTAMVNTFSANSGVTDSAAGGTALATGFKTNNDVVGLDADGNRVKNLMEASRELGKATGVVSTSTVTDATPASFTAHVPARGLQVEIAQQQGASDIDVILGGGQNYFSEYLLTNMRADGFKVAKTKAEMDAVPNDARIVGLFAGENMDTPFPVDTRGIEPTVAEMAQKAIDMLKDRSEEGFALMVEGSKIDKEAHGNNQTLMMEEAKQFDDAIKAAIDFAIEDGHTLVIVTADHETGGYSVPGELSLQSGTYPTCNWISGSHTSSHVPLYAYGAGSEEFNGFYSNTEIIKKVSRLMGMTNILPAYLPDEEAPVVPGVEAQIEFAFENGAQVAEGQTMTAAADITGKAEGATITVNGTNNTYTKFSTKGENAGRDGYAVRIGGATTGRAITSEITAGDTTTGGTTTGGTTTGDTTTGGTTTGDTTTGTAGTIELNGVTLQNSFSAQIRVKREGTGAGTLVDFGNGISLSYGADGKLICTYGGTAATTGVILKNDEWYNMAIAFDYDKKLVRLAVNGAPQWAGLYDTAAAPESITIAGDADGENVFVGAIDTFGVYNGLMDDDALKKLTSKGKKDVGDFELKASFNFAKETGNTNPTTANDGKVIDETGNYTADTNVNGTLTYTNDADATDGRALYMKNGSLEIANNALIPTGSFTVASRVKLNVNDSRWHMMIRMTEGDRLRFMIRKDDNRLMINMGGSESFEESTGFTITPGQYYTIVYVLDGIMGDDNDDTFTVYVDGVQVYSKMFKSGLPISNWVLSADGEYFDGYFDYVDIYDGAVTAQQAKMLASASPSKVGFAAQKLGNTLTATVESRFGAANQQPAVIYAAYDENNDLIEVNVDSVAANSLNPVVDSTYTFATEEAATFKLFLWDSMDGVMPMNNGYSFNSAMPSTIESYDFVHDETKITGNNVTEANYTSEGLNLNLNSDGSGKAYNDSTQEYINIPNPLTAEDEFTIAFRFRVPTSYGIGTGNTTTAWYTRSCILDGETGGVQNDFGIGMLLDGNKNRLIFGDDDAGDESGLIYTDGTEFIDGQFHTIAITRANGVASIYIDGILRGTGSCGTNVKDAPSTLKLGCSVDGTGRIGSFTISNLDFYDVELTADQVGNLYK